jgi:hypothetical protein
VLTQQLLRVDRSSFRGGSDARLEHGDRLQVIATAHFRSLSVTHCALELFEQNSFLGLVSLSSTHDAREFAVFPKYQPTMKDVQRRALADEPRVKLLPAFKQCVTG